MEHEPYTGGWWRALRLTVLGLCLLGSIMLLLETKTSLFARHISLATPICDGKPLPTVAKIDATELVALRASLLAAASEVGGRPYSAGATDTNTVWSDSPPLALSATRTVAGRWPAGFEMRRWSPNRDDIVLSVLQFSNTRQAQLFASQLSSPRCHRNGTSGTPPAPPYSRDITWINPLGYWQEDVILARGRLLYRIAEVGAQSEAISAQRTGGLRSTAAIACALVDAGCKRHRSPANSERTPTQRLSSRARTSRPRTSSPGTRAG
jgi:hypothetical protein